MCLHKEYEVRDKFEMERDKFRDFYVVVSDILDEAEFGKISWGQAVDQIEAEVKNARGS